MTLLLSLLLEACQAGEARKEGKQVIREWLVSAESKETANATELRSRYGQLASYIRNGYTAYTIRYNTTGLDGSVLVASGAIFVPDIQQAVPLMNYNHGTYFPSQEQEAPSYIGYGYEVMMGKLFASAGYLVVMPDYIGYGSTKDKPHPYGAYHEIGGSVIDMLRAVKEFVEKKEIRLSGKNFYCGWSEGAAVSLATVKLLENSHPGEFTPTTSVLNAGPYFSSGFVHHVLDATRPLKYMKTYAWILQSYNAVYNIGRPLSYYFREPAAGALKEGPGAYIPQEPHKLLTEEFRNNYRSGKDTALRNAFLRNDLWNWEPSSKVVFCHGDRDDYVPLFNSEKAYHTMKAKGADVELKVFKGQDHSSGVLQFVREAFENFEAAK